jgi:hypothetical protein
MIRRSGDNQINAVILPKLIADDLGDLGVTSAIAGDCYAWSDGATSDPAKRRRGNRITMPFASAHESARGPERRLP